MIRKFLPAYLLSQSEITDLVGQRVYPGKEPQKDRGDAASPADVYPCIVLRKLSRRTGRNYGNDGPAGDNLAYVHVESLARSYPTAQAVGKAVLAAMEAAPAVAAGVTAASAELLDDWDEIDIEAGGGDETVHSAVQVFSVLYADPAS